MTALAVVAHCAQPVPDIAQAAPDDGDTGVATEVGTGVETEVETEVKTEGVSRHDR